MIFYVLVITHYYTLFSYKATVMYSARQGIILLIFIMAWSLNSNNNTERICHDTHARAKLCFSLRKGVKNPHYWPCSAIRDAIPKNIYSLVPWFHVFQSVSSAYGVFRPILEQYKNAWDPQYFSTGVVECIIGLSSVELLSTPRFSSLEILCQHNTMFSQKWRQI